MPPTCATPACCASTTRWACSGSSSSPRAPSRPTGAYLAYPLDDLIGHIALESQRAKCIVVGEDLGTVAEGFRARLTRAKILGMRVLWFERKGAEVLAACRLSAAVGRLRRDPRSRDARRLVGRRGHRREAVARPHHAARRGRGDRGAARGEARPDRGAALRRAHRLGAARGRPARRRDRGGRPCADRRLGLAPRQRPVRRPRRRDGRDQPARHRPRAAELAAQARPGRRLGLRRRPGARDHRGAGGGARPGRAALGTQSRESASGPAWASNASRGNHMNSPAY